MQTDNPVKNSKQEPIERVPADQPPKVPVPPAVDPNAEPPKEPTQAGEVKRMRAFEALVATEGWKEYQLLLASHISTRASVAFEPVELANVLKSEHQKGTIYGLILARDIVGVSIAQVKDAVAAARKFSGQD